MTTHDSNGDVHHYQHRDGELNALDRRVKRVQRTLRNCRPKSREWRKRQRLVRSLRGRAAAIRSHSLGDLVDRGPDSFQAKERMEGRDRCARFDLVLRGNHDSPSGSHA